MSHDGSNRIAVMGLGKGGIRILEQLGRLPGSERLSLVALDCDKATAKAFAHGQSIVLGEGLDCIDGCGGETTLGERAAAIAAGQIRESIGNARLLLVAVGLGGGTGTGAAATVARHARDLGVPAFFVATLPFAFEGSWRMAQAESVLPSLRELAEAVVVVPNDALFSQYAADLSAAEAFVIADRLLAECLGGLAGMARADKLLAADFGVVRTILKRQQGTSRLATGKGSGEGRIQDAVASFLQCPLLGGAEAMEHVVAAVVNLQANYDISIAEVNQCVTAIQQGLREGIRTSIGVCRGEGGDADILITGILCQAHGATPSFARPGEADPAPKSGASANRSTPAGRTPVQEELPFQEYSLGIFAESANTRRYEGENLDIPTFQRRGVKLDLG